jgi:hypothetical protein
MTPRFEKFTTPHQQNQVLTPTKPNLLFKSGIRTKAQAGEPRMTIRSEDNRFDGAV